MYHLIERNIILLPGSRDNGAAKMVPKLPSNMDRYYDGSAGSGLGAIPISSPGDDLLRVGTVRIYHRLCFDGSAR